MTLSMIVAVSENGVIGDGNEMPWKQSEDLKWFKQLTTSTERPGDQNCVIMGRRTYESIGRPLPNRENVILTRNPDYEVEGCSVFQHKEAVLDYIKIPGMFACVIGGAEIYKLFLPHVSVLYLTRIHAIVQGDVRLDLSFLKDGWKKEESPCGTYDADEKNQYPYTFETYLR